MPLPFAFLNRRNFPTNLNLRHFMVISKFALMRQGMSLEDGQLKRLFRRLCRKYKTGNTLPKAILAKHVDNSECGCSACWVGLCPSKLLHQDYTIDVNSSETHDYPLHISEGVTLTVHGNLVSNLMTVAGTLIVHGTHTHKNLTILKTGRYHVHGSSASTEAAKTTIDTDTTNKYFVKNTGTFTVEQGATYTNTYTAMFVNDNIVNIFGTFLNKGTFDAVGSTTVETSGTFTNNYDYGNVSTTVINGTFNNNYNVSNDWKTGATMIINGTFNNNSAAEFDHGADDDSDEFGMLTLNGIFNNSGLFYAYNVLSSMTTNPGSSFTNTGTFTNYSNITIGGTFTSSGLFYAYNSMTTNTGSTFTNKGTFTNYSNITIGGTFNNNNKFYNGDGNVSSILKINGFFYNTSIFNNYFKASLSIYGNFYNRSLHFNNYSNSITVYGTLYNGDNGIGEISLSRGCSIKLLSGGTIQNTTQIFTFSSCPVYAGSCTSDGIIYSGGTLTGNPERITTDYPDWILIHKLNTSTYSQHEFNTGVVDQVGPDGNYNAKITLYPSDSVTALAYVYKYNKEIIASSSLSPHQFPEELIIKIQTSWFSDYLVEGNGYRYTVQIRQYNGIAETWYPFVHSTN
jgi:hypothetical protein